MSFPLLTESELKRQRASAGPWALGDIVISVDRAAVQARAHGHSLAEELDVLLVHGLLHLLGYDHERSSAEAKRMQALELRLLPRSLIGR